MPSSNSTLTYSLNGDTWTFKFPTVTVTQAYVPSAFGYAKMSTKYIYTVRSVLIATSPSDLAALQHSAEELLGAVGGTFNWNRDANDVIIWGPNDDVNFGPHPTALSFDKFFDTNTAMITWQLEVEVPAVDTDILDMVYTVSHTLDQNMYTTRVIAGMLRLNGSARYVNPATFAGADAYRTTIENYICSIPDDWQRVARQYDMSMDGLTITFSITDRQQYAVLPANCSGGEAQLSVEGNPRLGNKKDFRLTGWFEAPTDSPGAPQAGFVSLASSLFNFIANTESFRVKFLGVTKDIFRPRLQFTMVWDAFEPTTDGSIPGAPGTSEYTANWMLLLLTRSNSWLASLKGSGAISTDRGPYGTTDVRGFCGTGAVAPILEPEGYQTTRARAGDGNGSDSGDDGGDQSIVADGDTYYYRYRQTIETRTNWGVAHVAYKDVTKPDALQQVHTPLRLIKVQGELSLQGGSGSVPSVPPPPFTPDEVVILEDMSGTESVIVGPEYILRWWYVLKWKAVPAIDDNLRVPYSPFIAASEASSIFTHSASGDPRTGYKEISGGVFANDLTDDS